MQTPAKDPPTTGKDAFLIKDLIQDMSKYNYLSIKGGRERAQRAKEIEYCQHAFLGKNDGSRNLYCIKCSFVKENICRCRLEVPSVDNPSGERNCLKCGIILECEHDVAITDDSSGEKVCTKCGLVLRVFMEPPTLRELPQIDRILRESTFHDLCDAAMLNDGIAKRASTEFVRFRKLNECKHLSNKKLMAYSLHYATYVEGSPRPPAEISTYTGVKKSDLCDIESILPIPMELLKPEAFVSRFCYHLDLDGRDEIAIKKICSELTRVDAHDPRTVAASVIYSYSQQHKCAAGGTLTMKKIADVCDVSSSAISNCLPIISIELSSIYK